MDSWERHWEDFYAELGLAPAASQRVIRAAYRALAQEYHPDSGTTPDAERMKRINAAYEVLSDPATRARYDAAYRQRTQRRERGEASEETPPGANAEPSPASRHAASTSPGLRRSWAIWLAVLLLMGVGRCVSLERDDLGDTAASGSTPPGRSAQTFSPTSMPSPSAGGRPAPTPTIAPPPPTATPLPPGPTPTATPVPLSRPPTVANYDRVIDNFDNPLIGDFPKSSPDPEHYERGYLDGEYVIKIVDPDWGRQARAHPRRGLGNVVIEVDVWLPTPNAGQYAVVGCRLDGITSTGYEFYFAPEDDSFRLNRRDSLEQVSRLSDGSLSEFVTLASTNRVTMLCDGSTIAAWVNGEKVTSVLDSRYFRHGGLFLGVGTFAGTPSTAEVRFDNFRAGSPSWR